MSNITKSAVVALFLTMATLTLPLRAAKKSDIADEGQVALAVANWLQQAHYTRQPLDKEMSAKLLNTYLEQLDYNKLYFTQEDVDEFTKKYAATLDQAILRGNMEPPHEIFARFKTRVENLSLIHI